MTLNYALFNKASSMSTQQWWEELLGCAVQHALLEGLVTRSLSNNREAHTDDLLELENAVLQSEHIRCGS